jgi:hypothetical protein
MRDDINANPSKHKAVDLIHHLRYLTAVHRTGCPNVS